VDGKGKWKMIETIFETEGTNLKEVLRLENIDKRRTVSDDVYEVSKVLGIEAARAGLINETKKIFTQYGIYINYRHLYLLYDWMTHRGQLTAVNRNGINRIPEFSVLRKSSFEETVEILYDAAVFSEIDPVI
jgi:DNA-directed RNA polymerase beta' subunit